MHKCGKPHCGKFYHQHCVSQLPHAQIARDQEQEQGADDAEEEGVVKFKFTCPLHTCDLCGKGRESGSRSQLYPCWHCPRAYHANCIPPTSKYHEYLLLCPDHAHLELPHLPGWEDEEDGAAGGEQLLGGEAAAALAAGKVGGWVSVRASAVGGWCVLRGRVRPSGRHRHPILLVTPATHNPSTTHQGEDGWLAGVLCALLPRGKGLPFRLPRSTFAEVNSKPRPYSHIPCVSRSLARSRLLTCLPHAHRHINVCHALYHVRHPHHQPLIHTHIHTHVHTAASSTSARCPPPRSPARSASARAAPATSAASTASSTSSAW